MPSDTPRRQSLSRASRGRPAPGDLATTRWCILASSTSSRHAMTRVPPSLLAWLWIRLTNKSMWQTTTGTQPSNPWRCSLFPRTSFIQVRTKSSTQSTGQWTWSPKMMLRLPACTDTSRSSTPVDMATASANTRVNVFSGHFDTPAWTLSFRTRKASRGSMSRTPRTTWRCCLQSRPCLGARRLSTGHSSSTCCPMRRSAQAR
mmetsp:Transcript_67557/g.158528  ORF Transcript_67557/g.158528 Transcript_67557/m.158528 type:complete len:203 (-) Transcript_67557:1044-1652(-)